MTKPNLPEKNIARFEIQPTREVFKDLWLNRRHIVQMLAFIVSGIAIFTIIAANLSGKSFVVVSEVGAEVQTTVGATAKPEVHKEIKQIRTDLDAVSALYFTMINMTTVGFGDIVPFTTGARVLSIANSVFGLLSFALLVSILSAAISAKDDSLTLVSGSVQFAEAIEKIRRAVVIEISRTQKKARVLRAEDAEDTDAETKARERHTEELNELLAALSEVESRLMYLEISAELPGKAMQRKRRAVKI